MNDPQTDRPEDFPAGPGQVPPRAPPWVWVLGIIAVVLVLAFVVFHLAGGGVGRHGAMPGAVPEIAEYSVQRS